MNAVAAHDGKEFSILDGGPLHRIQVRLGLMKHRAPRIARRAVIFALIAWLPLLILSALQGLLLANVKIPFLYDPSAYSRFLVAVPLLIVAEMVIGPRIAETTSQFVTSGMITEHNHADFDSAVADTLKLRDSTLAEVVILAITYAGAFEAIRAFSSNVSTWHALVSESGHRFTLAGYWYALVALPIFQFLVFRWLWRTFIWCRFLRRMSKLDLQFVPTHPDRAAGLGFVGEAHRLFAILIFAIGATGSGLFSREVLFEGISIQTFRIPVAGFIVVSLLIFLGPLFMFSPSLLKTRREGLHQYGALGSGLGRLFHQKWVKGVNPAGESELGNPDISSLADYGRAYELVDQMRIFPFEPRTAVVLALAGLIPMVPLLATVLPMEQMLKLFMAVLA